MIDKSQLTKRYYNISEVAKLFGISNSMLRYWEGEFNAIKPTKGRNGIRRYTVSDIEKIEHIYILIKERGFTIDGARKELKKTGGKGGDALLKERLVSLKKRLVRLRRMLDYDDDAEE